MDNPYKSPESITEVSQPKWKKLTQKQILKRRAIYFLIAYISPVLLFSISSYCQSQAPPSPNIFINNAEDIFETDIFKAAFVAAVSPTNIKNFSFGIFFEDLLKVVKKIFT